MNQELSKSFFNRSAVVVAEELLGKYLVRKIKGEITKYKIMETEAYEGLNDKASHASRGKTKRNAPMFGEAGTIYVYFTYGMHWMFNIVCGAKEYPAAVLIRGVTTSSPAPLLAKERGEIPKINLSGPARLTKYLKIDKSLNNQKLGRMAGLWIETPTMKITKLKIQNLPRIGVSYAGPVWSAKKWRFVLKINL